METGLEKIKELEEELKKIMGEVEQLKKTLTTKTYPPAVYPIWTPYWRIGWIYPMIWITYSNSTESDSSKEG